MKLSDNTYKKYINTFDTDEYEILSDAGFVDLKSISITIEYEVWNVSTVGGLYLECADTHILFKRGMIECYARDLLPGDEIEINGRIDVVSSIINTGKFENMCDAEVGGNNRFYTNNILSHNSLVLANLAVRAARGGANIGVFTVELADRKYVKRLGANLLNVPYTLYAKFLDENDLGPIIEAIDKFKMLYPNAGQMMIKEYPTGGANAIDIENYFLALEKSMKIHFDIIFVDYINLLKPTGKADATMYEKIKKIAEELRRIAQRNSWCIVSATQVKSTYFNSDDLFLDSAAESSGLIATVDSYFGIMPPEPNSPKLKIKNIANRDEGHMDSFKIFEKEKTYFRLIEDTTPGSEFWSEEDGEDLQRAMIDEYRKLASPHLVDTKLIEAQHDEALKLTNTELESNTNFDVDAKIQKLPPQKTEAEIKRSANSIMTPNYDDMLKNL